MKLALERPVQILIIGAGGTGGYVIPHLYRIAFASNRKCRIVIADGDIVEDKNLVRQSFSSLDVGENKATVMAERYSDVFGIETEYIPDFIEDAFAWAELKIPTPFGIIECSIKKDKEPIIKVLAEIEIV